MLEFRDEHLLGSTYFGCSSTHPQDFTSVRLRILTRRHHTKNQSFGTTQKITHMFTPTNDCNNSNNDCGSDTGDHDNKDREFDTGR